jgi:hypothetical protein
MKSSAISLAATLAFLAAGCSTQPSATSQPSATQPSKITVLLKDAPSNGVEQAWVTFTEIALVGSGGTTVLATNTMTVELVRLANTTETLVKDVDVPAGTYAQLRFVITDGCLLAGGIWYSSSATCTGPSVEGSPPVPTGTLRMPSYAQSGLKVNLPGSLGTIGSGTRIVLVDFDVEQSYGHQAGNSGAWVMHPVVTATDFQLSGTIDVSLAYRAEQPLPGTNTLADFKAELSSVASDNTLIPIKAINLAGTNTLESGSVSFTYLVPGNYAVGFTAPSGVNAVYSPNVPLPVVVDPGQVTKAAFELTSFTLLPKN